MSVSLRHQSDVNYSCDVLEHSDHLYCRNELADEDTEDMPSQLSQLMVKSGGMNTMSLADCSGTLSEATDSHIIVSSASDENVTQQCELSHTASVVTVQSLDVTLSTLSGMSNCLDIADTEDVSLDSSTSDISDSDTGTVSLDMTSSVSSSDSVSRLTADNDTLNNVCRLTAENDTCDSLSRLTADNDTSDSVSRITAGNDTCDSVSRPTPGGCSDTCEVVDLSGGRLVQLECQCGAHYNDPRDKLHVVKCQRCHSHQHANCVNYDVTDPLRGLYLCPHCHVIEVCMVSCV